MNQRTDRGAVAVEMALLLPVLILILLGVMEFGRAYNTQVNLTNAAREGVRFMAITRDEGDAVAAAKGAASTLAMTSTNPKFTFGYADSAGAAYTSCASQRQVTMKISYSLETLTGIAGPFTLTGKGTMLCGG